MASRKTRGTRPERRFVVHGVRRESPDLRKLSKALLAVVLSQKQQGEAGQAEEGSAG